MPVSSFAPTEYQSIKFYDWICKCQVLPVSWGVSSLATARCQITDWREASAAKGGSGLHTQAILCGTMDWVYLPNFVYHIVTGFKHCTCQTSFSMYVVTGFQHTQTILLGTMDPLYLLLAVQCDRYNVPGTFNRLHSQPYHGVDHKKKVQSNSLLCTEPLCNAWPNNNAMPPPWM